MKIHNENVKKHIGLYEIENIDKANICTIAVKTKEYFEKFRNRSINKKHKSVRRDTPEMNFQSFTERIKVLRETDSEQTNKKMLQKRLLVKNTKMKVASVSKAQFANLNDKRYYFSDRIVSLPFGHPLLSDLREFKKSFPKIHTVIEKEKNKLLKMENQAVAKNQRCRVLPSIYAQPITYYKLNSNTKVIQKNSFDFTTTQDYILNSKWL